MESSRIIQTGEERVSEVSALLGGLASGSVEIVDLTQPLTETTPVLKLPPPFANTPGLSREEISRYDDRGPAWAWYTLTIGEHVGTHLDAPIHWITGKDGKDVGSIDAQTLIGPACVIDKTAETEADNGYLLTVQDLEGWEAEHGRVPNGAWVLLRTGWSRAPTMRRRSSTPARTDPSRPVPTSTPPGGWRTSAGSPGSASRRSGSMRARPVASIRRSRCTTSCSARASSVSRSSPTSTSCR